MGSGRQAARRDVFAVDERRAVEALELSWGAAYRILARGGWYCAERRRGRREELTGVTPDALARALIADWACRG